MEVCIYFWFIYNSDLTKHRFKQIFFSSPEANLRAIAAVPEVVVWSAIVSSRAETDLL